MLPTAENAEYEFKSSQTEINELKKKLTWAISAFGNSGGGCFVAGVNDNGDADGGVPNRIGSQDLCDWADQIIHQVEPTPPYQIELITDANGRGSITTDHSVLVVVVDEAHSGPHMAPDNRYYIRAGAHTERARHFIIDAIWAKRHFTKPRLAHVFRHNPDDRQWIQLGIVALTSAPAVEVEINLSPLGELLKGENEWFPLQIPAIDRQNPFFFDVTTSHKAEERFGADVVLRVTYKDLADNPYTYETEIQIEKSIAPLVIGRDPNEKMAKALESIEKSLRVIAQPRSDADA